MFIKLLMGLGVLVLAAVLAVLILAIIMYYYFVHGTKKHFRYKYEYVNYDEFFMYLEAWALYDDISIRLLDPMDTTSAIVLVNTSDKDHYITEGELSPFEITICDHHLILGFVNWINYCFWRAGLANTLQDDYLKHYLKEEMHNEKSCKN